MRTKKSELRKLHEQEPELHNFVPVALWGSPSQVTVICKCGAFKFLDGWRVE